MQYRPEIDGLRALAVLPVMAYHAVPQAAPAGYLGVDIFFVISGFLITSLIISEHQQGEFSLLGFWERRARRILPLLTIVVLACLPPAWALLGLFDAEEFAKSLFASAAFASNFLFWWQESYFGARADFKPLLHTWSLAVEEQFYLLFPLLCLVALKWSRAVLAVVLVVMAALSLIAWAYLFGRDYDAAFFLSPLRAWQLLAGSLCALASRRLHRLREHKCSGLLSAMGLALIAIIFLAPIGEWAWSRSAVLAVTSGACLLVLFADQTNLTGRFLSLKPLVAIGLVSYGAYLWHVPILVFARHAFALKGNPELERVVDLPPFLAIGLCVFSLLLAALTWKLIEQPARNRASVSTRALAIILFSSWALILLVGALMPTGKAQPQFHLVQVRQFDAEKAELFLRHVEKNEAEAAVVKRDNGACVFSVDGFDSTTLARISACYSKHGSGVLLIGDSHAADLHKALLHTSTSDTFLVTRTAPGCRIGNDACFYDELESELARGLGLYFDVIAYHEIGSGSILDAAGYPDSQLAFMRPAEATIDFQHLSVIAGGLSELSNSFRGKVVLIGAFYEPRINLRRAQPLSTGWTPRATNRTLFRKLDEAAARAMRESGISYISLAEVSLAPNDVILHNDCLLFRDLDHLSPCGTKAFADQLEKAAHPLLSLVR